MIEIIRLGDAFDPSIKNKVFILDISEHIQPLNPKEYDYDHPPIDPNRYFVTSGDAVEKTKILIRHIKELNSKVPLDHHFKSIAENYESQANRLLNLLIQARGKDCFLETEWGDNHTLRCIPKNPRR